jgi:squalene-hopene/tetraprenyl-beta-curcumene cyclase
VSRGVNWLLEATNGGAHTPATPIGLYFARLWYSEELYPTIFALNGLGTCLSQARREHGRLDC